MKTLCTKCLAGDKSLPHEFPADARPPFVAICTPVYDRPAMEYVDSMRMMWKPSTLSAQFPGGGHVNHIAHAMVIERARNDLTGQALALPQVTHVLFVDDDMRVPPHALLRLMEHDLPIVGGLCHNRRAPYNPIVVREVPDGGSRYMYDLPDDGLVECDFTGGAFVLIKREVFEAMNEAASVSAHAVAGTLPVAEKAGLLRDNNAVAVGLGDAMRDVAVFHANGWWTPLDAMTEDFSFMERARRLGFRVMVDCGLDIGHVGEVVIDRRTAERLRDFRHAAYEEGVTPAEDGKPVATIVIPTFNQRPELLRAAVMSAALQTVPVEVIVVDDGSREPVPFDAWHDYPSVRVIRHALSADHGPRNMFAASLYDDDQYPDAKPMNRGIAAALNTGIQWMRTDWFCWLSSDDMLSPYKVEKQLRAMKVAGVKASFHRYQVLECDAEGRPVEDFPRHSNMPMWRDIDEQMEWLLHVCAINGSTVMIHRDLMLAPVAIPSKMLGYEDTSTSSLGFDGRLRYSQDYEFWLRTAREHFWLPINETLGTRRELNGPAGNLTAQIAVDPAKKARHEAEDAAIRAFYGAAR